MSTAPENGKGGPFQGRSYVDDITGELLPEWDVERDYPLRRLRKRADIDALGRDDLAIDYPKRHESPEVEP